MFTEMDVQQAICLIRDLGYVLKKIKGGLFSTDLLSTLGELKVFLELKRQFPDSEISFKGKARADILVDGVNIEVKTSNLKREDYGVGYGFALHVKKCRRHPQARIEHTRRGPITGDLCYLDYLICVAIDEKNLENPTYYIFSREELNNNAPKLVNKSKRFWWALYRILIPVEPYLIQKGILYNDFYLQLAKDRDKFKDRWDKIEMKNY